MFYLDPPVRLDAQPFTSLPDKWAVPGTSAAARAKEWANNILAGKAVSSLLEGPCFDSAGNLYVVDIPFGRIFRIAPDGSWSLFASYYGWPNGLKVTSDGRILVADHRQGLVEITEIGKAVGGIGFRLSRRMILRIQRPNPQPRRLGLFYRPGTIWTAGTQRLCLSVSSNFQDRRKGSFQYPKSQWLCSHY